MKTFKDGSIMTMLKRLALEESWEYRMGAKHRKAREKTTLDQFPKCEYCGEESEHVIRSEDGEDRRITCDSDACIDSANGDMDGRRE